MKRYLLLVITVLMAITLSAQETQTKTKVAIYTTGDVDTNYKKVIGSKVTSIITQSNEYAAVERTADFLNALSQEQDYQTSGAVSDNQIVKIGQQFGVRYVIVLDISDLFGSIFVSARMIDVRTGLIKKSTELGQEIDSLEGLISLSTNIASQFLADKYKCYGPVRTLGEMARIHLEEINFEKYRICDWADVENMKDIGMQIKYPIYVHFSTSWPETYCPVACDAYGFNKDGSKIGFKYSTVDLDCDDRSRSITPGYIYLVEKENND